MLNLSTHQLRIFLEAAETMNFTQAALRLQMTQPSISQHIQALEEHFGQPLFVRAGRSLELTEAGQVLVPLAREMIYLATHLEERMASLQGDVHGHLLVGCSTSTGRYILPKLLACFHSQYRQVRTTCHVSGQPEAMQMLMEGKVNLAMASAHDFVQEIEYHLLARERILLIVPPSHPWASRGVVDLEELLETDFILPDEGTEMHATLREALATKELSIYQLQTQTTLGSVEAIAFAVQEGLGVGFVPELLVNRLVHGRVAVVSVRNLEIIREIFIARNIRRTPTEAQQAFWDYLTDPENQVLKSLGLKNMAEGQSN